MYLQQTKYLLTTILVFSTLFGLSGIERLATQTQAQTLDGGVDTVSADFVMVEGPRDVLRVAPGVPISVTLQIKNTGAEPWYRRSLRLGAVYTTGATDRPSRWATSDWVSPSRISPVNLNDDVYTGNIATFSFTMQSPQYPGLYKETFQPMLDGYRWLAGEPISLAFEVIGGPQVQSATFKEVKVYVATQTAELIENGFVVASLPVSTGKSGYDTPRGKYKVHNKFDEAFSQRYGVWMSNWMGLVREGQGIEGYGMHSLAYWRVNPAKYVEGEIKDGRLYTNGRLYEDVEHLGTPRSHGCIRLGIYESGVVSNWVEVGTPLTVI